MKQKFAIALISIFSFANITLASEMQQTGIATVLPGNEIAIYLPENFSFNSTFIPTSGNKSLSKLLTPDSSNSRLTVHDLDPTRSFVVTMSATDLINSENQNRIRFSDLEVVTLSSSTDYSVDGQLFNSPPFAPNLNAPLDCDIPTIDTWQEQCSSNFTSYKIAPEITSTLTGPLFPGQTKINMNTINFNLQGSVEIENDIIQYTNKEPTRLLNASNIDIFHPSGAVVKQYWENSLEETIMEDYSISDMGLYSIGFGFLLNIANDFSPGNYEGIITFTLITS